MCKQICQSYLSFCPTIRIRKSDTQYFLTVKGKGHIKRDEFEMEIEEKEYEHLYKKVEGKEIRKKRFLIPIENNFLAEVDIYEGQLKGLMTTEVEFSTIEEAEGFVAPSWFGEDISKDSRYKNTSLSLYGKPE